MITHSLLSKLFTMSLACLYWLGLCCQVKAQSESKWFGGPGGIISGESIHVDAYKVVKTKDGKKFVDKQIKVTITKRFSIDDRYTETFLEEKDYKSLYKALGEFVTLSNKWKGRLLEEDSKSINIREQKVDEEAKKQMKEAGLIPEITYDIFAYLELNKSGDVQLDYHQEGVFTFIGSPELKEFRKSIEDAIIWLDKPFDKKAKSP